MQFDRILLYLEYLNLYLIVVSKTQKIVVVDLFFFFFLNLSLLSWAGARRHTNGVVFPVHHVMPNSGGAVGTRWYAPFGGGSSGLSSSTS